MKLTAALFTAATMLAAMLLSATPAAAQDVPLEIDFSLKGGAGGGGVGKPGDKIVEYGRESNADVIVMGMRGIGGAARLFLGSTSEGVLKRAEVPVLVVPPPKRNP